MRRLLPLIALAVAAPAAAADDAPVRMLTVVNDTSAAVNQLFVAGKRSPGWRAKVSGIVGSPADERDRLETKLLPRGGSIAIELHGERCRYDVRAVLVDGRSYAGPVDVCAAPRARLSQLARP